MAYWWFEPTLATVFAVVLIVLVSARLFDAAGIKPEITWKIICVCIGLLMALGLFCCVCLVVGIWMDAIPV